MGKEQTFNTLYPVFLKLHQLEVLIVGGGAIGGEKLGFMMKNSPDAKVTLVAPEIGDKVRRLARTKDVKLYQREFKVDDLKNKHLVILATGNPGLNLQIRKQAKTKNLLVNVVDTPDLCDFYLGSIVTKGDLKIAISTNGKSPTFSKKMRKYLEEALPEETPQLLNNLRKFRDQLKGDFKSKVKKLNQLTSVITLNKKERSI